MQSPLTVKATIVYNPLDVSNRQDVDLLWRKSVCLADYVDGLPEEHDWSVAIDGKAVPASAYRIIFPKPGAHIVVAPVPYGGGGSGNGKNILAIVATIALTVAAPGIGGAIAGAMGASATGLLATVASAAISVAGAMLISAFMPRPETNDAAGGQSFGIDGPKNTSTEGVPVPVIYGEFAFGGNYETLYTENDTDKDGYDTQIIIGRVIVSEGPVEGFSNFKLNDQPIDQFSNVEIDYRLGTQTQSEGKWFGRTIRMVSHQREVLQEWAGYTTTGEIDRFRIDFVMAGGLINYGEDGRALAHNIRVRLRYRLTGTTTWHYVRNSDVEEIVFKDKITSPVRRSIHSETIPEGVYEIEWYRSSSKRNADDKDPPDPIAVADVAEILHESSALPNTAWVGFKTRLSGQLSGIPTFTGTCRGRKLDIYDHNGNKVENRFSDNPADVALDMLMHDRYAGQAEHERPDWAKFADWRDACTADNLTFNHGFSEISNIEDAINHVFAAGRAERVTAGAKISVVMERQSDPVMMFDQGNIEKDSFRVTYIPISDRINDLEGGFADAANGYQEGTVRATNDESIRRGEPLRPASIRLVGITDIRRAQRELNMRMAANRLIHRIASWRAPAEALNCTVGDVVYLQHPMPNWEHGGRLLTSSASGSVTLDAKIELEAGVRYKMLLHHSTHQLASGTITAQSSNLITIDVAYLDPAKAHRAVIGGVDYKITRVFDDTTTTTRLLVKDLLTSVNGLPIEIWTIDHIETVDLQIQTVTVETDEVVIEGAFTQPVPYSNYMIGKSSVGKRKFRIKKIGRANDGKMDLEGIEYVPAIYDEAAITVNPTAHLPLIGHVTNLELVETFRSVAGGGVATQVTATWRPSFGSEYLGAEIYVARDDAPFERVASVLNTSYTISDCQVGDRIRMRVVAKTTHGIAPFSTAPQAEVILAGKTSRPAAPVVLATNPGIDYVGFVMQDPPGSEAKQFNLYGAPANDTRFAVVMRTPATEFFYRPTPLNFTVQYYVTVTNTSGVESLATPIYTVEPIVVDVENDVVVKVNDAFAQAEQTRLDHDKLVGNFTGTITDVFAEVDSLISDFEPGIVALDALKGAQEGITSSTGTVERVGNWDFGNGWAGWVTSTDPTADPKTLTDIETGEIVGDETDTLFELEDSTVLAIAMREAEQSLRNT